MEKTAAMTKLWQRNETLRLWETSDKRVWFVLEAHPQTKDGMCVCREVTNVELLWLGNTAVIERKDLTEIQ